MPMMRTASVLCGTAVVLLVGACSERLGTGPGGPMGELRINAAVNNPTLSTLVVEVLAADLSDPLVFNFEFVDGVASGTIRVPAGADRTIVVRAYDVGGIQTHEGQATVDIRPGVNPSVRITLRPLSGNQPIEIVLGSFTVAVEPAGATLAVGQSLQLEATVTDVDGTVVGGTADVVWASDAPAVATVDAGGLVTAHLEGSARIVASFGGVAAAAELTVVTIVFTAVRAAHSHTCGTTPDAVYCWGNGNFGKLGQPSATGVAHPVPALAATGGLLFVQFVIGGEHNCGLTTGGAVHCWGRNDLGQLGDGTTLSRFGPSQVVGSGTGALVFSSIDAGAHHTCGVAVGNAVYCWGNNSFGQVGDGGTVNRTAPMQVAGSGAGALLFTSVSAGGDHSCGRTTTGALYCWGRNGDGQLGNGTATTAATPTPTLVSGSEAPLSFDAVVVGGFHTCGLTAGHEAFCWGRNADGQLGDGSATQRTTPAPVLGDLLWSALVAGSAHTCGLVDDAAWCWGLNADGRLGDGTIASRTVPVPVAGSLRWVELSAGTSHTCGRTAEPGTPPYCWGSNLWGQLGDGTLDDRHQPVKVMP